MPNGQLKLGFVALLDAAPLLVAKERGFFAEQGLAVELARQPSWASLRDRLAVGALDAGQMLAPLTLAASLGLAGLNAPLITGLALNLGGNGITLSAALMARLAAVDPAAAALRPLDARLLARALQHGGAPPVFAIVHPFSAHHYELRLWLAAGGLDADRDVQLVVVPPAQMLSNLSAGAIDGYCVGEPWNQLAARAGLGQVAATSRDLWPGRIEKVLAVRQDWADRNDDRHRALLRAILRAAAWSDQPQNRAELAELLARPHHLNVPAPVLRALLDGPGAPLFHRSAANFPWRSQGHWYLAQMRACGQLQGGGDCRRLVEQVFRADLARLAYLDLGLPVPLIDSRIEGAHDSPWLLTAATAPIEMDADRFFAGAPFDPDHCATATDQTSRGEAR